MRLIFSFCVLVLVLFNSCKKNRIGNVEIFGHAGMGLSMQNSLFHDNSLEAVQLCLAMPGSNGVEVDVQMDKNGNLWLYHNQFLDNITSIKGCINSNYFSNLSGSYYKTIKKEKLAQLKNVFDHKGHGQKLFLDIKNGNSCLNNNIDINLFEKAIGDLIDSSNNDVYLIFNDKIWLNHFANQYHVLYSSDNVEEGKTTILQNIHIEGLVIRNKSISKEKISELKTLEKLVFLYDIRSPKGNRQALLKEPDGIITDDIRAALIERN